MLQSPDELLAELAASPNHPYPFSYVRTMLARREEMTPVLLGILEDAAIHPETYLEEEGFWKLTTFAAFLLAQWRDTRAYRPLCATLNLPAKIADDLWGDMICEDMGRILASVYDGDDSPLRSVMANPEAYEFIRGATIPLAYTCLMEAGKISAGHVENYAAWLFTEGLERIPSHAWQGWIMHCAELGFARLSPLVEKAFEEGLVDFFFARPDEILANLQSGRPSYDPDHVHLVEDTIAETSWWCCWEKPADPRPRKKELPFNERIYTPAPKIGRNDPCPCNSGKKYKKCCGKG